MSEPEKSVRLVDRRSVALPDVKRLLPLGWLVRVLDVKASTDIQNHKVYPGAELVVFGYQYDNGRPRVDFAPLDVMTRFPDDVWEHPNPLMSPIAEWEMDDYRPDRSRKVRAIDAPFLCAPDLSDALRVQCIKKLPVKRNRKPDMLFLLGLCGIKSSYGDGILTVQSTNLAEYCVTVVNSRTQQKESCSVLMDMYDIALHARRTQNEAIIPDAPPGFKMNVNRRGIYELHS